MSGCLLYQARTVALIAQPLCCEASQSSHRLENVKKVLPWNCITDGWSYMSGDAVKYHLGVVTRGVCIIRTLQYTVSHKQHHRSHADRENYHSHSVHPEMCQNGMLCQYRTWACQSGRVGIVTVLIRRDGWVQTLKLSAVKSCSKKKHREACRRVGLLETVHVAGLRSVFYPLGLTMLLPQPATLYVLSAAGHLVGILGAVKGGGFSQFEQPSVILKGLLLIKQV